MSGRSVDVLVYSPDADFRALARAVLRAEGYDVVATSVVAERLPRQLRLRTPRVLLFEGTESPELRECAAAAGARVVRVLDGRPAGRSDGRATVSKWAPAAELIATIEQTLARTDTPRRLRLVRP